MALSWNEIRSNALAFVNEWKGETREEVRLEFLFNLYQEYTAEMFVPEKKKKLGK